jgi:hypothetical protein
MRRRDLIKGIAGSAAAWPLAAYAQQQSAMPVVAVVNLGTAEANARFVRAFSKGLEAGLG